jgi:hypothetical protein
MVKILALPNKNHKLVPSVAHQFKAYKPKGAAARRRIGHKAVDKMGLLNIISEYRTIYSKVLAMNCNCVLCGDRMFRGLLYRHLLTYHAKHTNPEDATPCHCPFCNKPLKSTELPAHLQKFNKDANYRSTYDPASSCGGRAFPPIRPPRPRPVPKPNNGNITATIAETKSHLIKTKENLVPGGYEDAPGKQ